MIDGMRPLNGPNVFDQTPHRGCESGVDIEAGCTESRVCERKIYIARQLAIVYSIAATSLIIASSLLSNLRMSIMKLGHFPSTVYPT